MFDTILFVPRYFNFYPNVNGNQDVYYHLNNKEIKLVEHLDPEQKKIWSIYINIEKIYEGQILTNSDAKYLFRKLNIS